MVISLNIVSDASQSRARRTIRIGITLGAVFILTFVFHVIIPVNATTIGFVYLIAVLLIAASWGLMEAVVASITATACFNYFFLPPTFTWTISDPENWVAFVAFLVSSLVASELSNRAKRRAVEAMNRQAELERLYALSRALMLMDVNTPATKQIAHEIARIYSIPLAAVGDLEAAIRNAVDKGMLSQTAADALGNLIATHLESARSREIATKAEASRQSEEFKSTLLDGLAHEFKTPLTSIKAVTTALLSGSVSNVEQQHELLTVADQEAERLNQLVTDAIHLARIEAGKVQLNKGSYSIRDIVQRSLDQTATLHSGRSIEVSIPDNLPAVDVDSELMRLTIRQLIDNAIKYSPEGSAIQINVTQRGESIVVGIHNWGEPLSEMEQLRIFEKFYRGRNARHQPAGAGMGLAIAREILRAHGGDLRVESSVERGTGFFASLPCEVKESVNEFIARAGG